MQPSVKSPTIPSGTIGKSGGDLRLTCPQCGLTAQELRDSGRMGCSTCYQIFSDMVAQAAAELHGSGEAGRNLSSPALPADRNTSPWPTRKALPPRSSTDSLPKITKNS